MSVNTLTEEEFKKILGPAIDDNIKHDLWIETNKKLVDKYTRGEKMSPVGARLASSSLNKKRTRTRSPLINRSPTKKSSPDVDDVIPSESNNSVKLVMSSSLAKNILSNIHMGELFKIVIATLGIDEILDWNFWATRYYKMFGNTREYHNMFVNKNVNSLEWMDMTKNRYDNYRMEMNQRNHRYSFF